MKKEEKTNRTSEKQIIRPEGRKWKLLFLSLLLCAILSGGCSGGQIPISDWNAQAEDTEENTKPVSVTDEDAPTESGEAYTDEDASANSGEAYMDEDASANSGEAYTGEDIPAFSGEPYVVLNGNLPEFEEWDSTEAFENYSELDELGRCRTAYANICIDLMPTEPRGEIGMIKPSGWHTVKYDFIDGKYLYNRCHLIGYQLSGENANEKNLMTGTRYMNVEGMLPFENLVAEYVKETKNHVLYRVTPVYDGENLVADGVKMEAWSVEDEGEGVCFCVFVYNCQPGVVIDYATGESRAEEESAEDLRNEETEAEMEEALDAAEYILNTNTHKFHKPDCSSVSDIKPQNKSVYYGSREELIGQGYDPCGRCSP